MIATANRNFIEAGERLGTAIGQDALAPLSETIQKIVLFLAKYGFDADSPIKEGEALQVNLERSQPCRQNGDGMEAFFMRWLDGSIRPPNPTSRRSSASSLTKIRFTS
jgi:hypothetical protein